MAKVEPAERVWSLKISRETRRWFRRRRTRCVASSVIQSKSPSRVDNSSSEIIAAKFLQRNCDLNPVNEIVRRPESPTWIQSSINRPKSTRSYDALLSFFMKMMRDKFDDDFDAWRVVGFQGFVHIASRGLNRNILGTYVISRIGSKLIKFEIKLEKVIHKYEWTTRCKKMHDGKGLLLFWEPITFILVTHNATGRLSTQCIVNQKRGGGGLFSCGGDAENCLNMMNC